MRIVGVLSHHHQAAWDVYPANVVPSTGQSWLKAGRPATGAEPVPPGRGQRPVHSPALAARVMRAAPGHLALSSHVMCLLVPSTECSRSFPRS